MGRGLVLLIVVIVLVILINIIPAVFALETLRCRIYDPLGGLAKEDAKPYDCLDNQNIACSINCVPTDPACCSMEGNYSWGVNVTEVGNGLCGSGSIVERYEYEYQGWVPGHQTPRCGCDTSSVTVNCPSVFPADEADPDTCYDQYRFGGMGGQPRSREYLKHYKSLNAYYVEWDNQTWCTSACTGGPVVWEPAVSQCCGDHSTNSTIDPDLDSDDSPDWGSASCLGCPLGLNQGLRVWEPVVSKCCGDDAGDEPDWGQASCLGCPLGLNQGLREWNIGGIPNCCRDDAGEHIRICEDDDWGLCNQSENKLDYWVEQWNPSGTSIIWVKVTDPGTKIINMYYGNPLAASESDGEATFEFFDNFSSENSSKFTYGEAYGPSEPVLYEVSSGLLKEWGDGATWRILRMKRDFAPSDNVAVRARFMTEGKSNWLQNYLVQSSNINRNRFGLRDMDIANREFRVQYQVDNGGLQYSGTLATLTTDTWYKDEVIKKSSTDFEAKLYNDDGSPRGSSFSQSQAGWSDETWTWVNWQRKNVNVYYDWIHVRKYSDPEPVASVGGGAPAAGNWAYKRPITLDIATAEVDYQVRIELDPSNFDYSKVKPDGSDMRLYGKNNRACCNQSTDCVYNDMCYAWQNQTGEWKCGAVNLGVWHDVVPPFAEIRINDGYPYTITRNATLNLSFSDNGTGRAEYLLENDDGYYKLYNCSAGQCPFLNWTSNWTLSLGDGMKTVHFKVKDHAGNFRNVSDTIIMDTTDPIAWIDPPLPDWTGLESEHWAGSADGSVKAFNMSWRVYDVSGAKCYQVQYNTSSVPWTNWTIDGTSCTPLEEWTFGPLSPVQVLDGEAYSFRVRAVDNVNRLGNWSPENHTTPDTVRPELNLTAVDQDGRSILGIGVISYKDVSRINITSSALDTISGIRDNHIYYCRVYAGVEDCWTEHCGSRGPGDISYCSVGLDYGENMVIKFRVVAEDYAGNHNASPGLNRYFFVTDHALVNFVAHYLEMTIGDGAFLKVQVRNLQTSFDNVTLNISGYEFASFADTGNVDLSPDRRSAWVGLNPYEERELFVKVLSSAIGQYFININATSVLTEKGNPCSGPDCVTDSDTALITIGYLPEFPEFNVWGILLLVAASLIIYSGVDGKALNH